MTLIEETVLLTLELRQRVDMVNGCKWGLDPTTALEGNLEINSPIGAMQS